MVWRGGGIGAGRAARVCPVKLQVARALQVCGGASGSTGMMPIMNNDSIDQGIWRWLS